MTPIAIMRLDLTSSALAKEEADHSLTAIRH